MLTYLISALIAGAMVVGRSQTPKPSAREGAPDRTLKGCVRASEIDKGDPKRKYVVYSLEVPGDKEVYELSADPKLGLSKHVGHQVEITGELLQPPAMPPGARSGDPDDRKHLPIDSQGTFRITRVKMISAKCPVKTG